MVGHGSLVLFCFRFREHLRISLVNPQHKYDADVAKFEKEIKTLKQQVEDVTRTKEMPRVNTRLEKFYNFKPQHPVKVPAASCARSHLLHAVRSPRSHML